MTTTGITNPERTDAAPTGSTTRSLRSHRYLWIGLGSVAGVVLLFLALLNMRPPQLHGVVLQSPQPVTDFTLTASTGEPLALSDLRGRLVLLYFGYTFCPDVCPTTLADLRMMAQALGDRQMQEVQVVMVTVDPARDTPERLGEYMGYFDPRFIGLTGALETIDAAATQLGVYFEQNEVTGAADYLVDHTSAVTLIDGDGYVRMVFPYGTTGEAMAADLRYWLRR